MNRYSGIAVLLLLVVAGVVTLAPPAARGQAQSGASCQSVSVVQESFALEQVQLYRMVQEQNRTRFDPAETIGRDKLPKTMVALVCGNYARIEVDGRRVFVRTSSFTVSCVCNADQLRSASAPGAGNWRQCPAETCRN